MLNTPLIDSVFKKKKKEITASLSVLSGAVAIAPVQDHQGEKMWLLMSEIGKKKERVTPVLVPGSMDSWGENMPQTQCLLSKARRTKDRAAFPCCIALHQPPYYLPTTNKHILSCDIKEFIFPLVVLQSLD